MLEYLEPFVQTIVILVGKQISYESFKNKITNYWLKNHLYNHLTVCKQMSLKMLYTNFNYAFANHIYV